MKFDCSKNCKMTKEMRSSSYCNGTAEVVDGAVIYSCEKNILKASEPEQNFLKCNLWDNQILEACKTCELKCKKNCNPKLKATIEESRELKALIDGLRPSMVLYGVNDKTIEKISKEYKKTKDDRVKHALEAAKLSNNSIKLMQKGKPIDIAYLSIVSSRLLKKIKKQDLEE